VMITRGVSAQSATSPIYFPYPPDVIPNDLAPEETKRVNREVSGGQPGIQIRCALWSAPPIISTPNDKPRKG
jgi:hypothetical protein